MPLNKEDAAIVDQELCVFCRVVLQKLSAQWGEDICWSRMKKHNTKTRTEKTKKLKSAISFLSPALFEQWICSHFTTALVGSAACASKQEDSGTESESMYQN